MKLSRASARVACVCVLCFSGYRRPMRGSRRRWPTTRKGRRTRSAPDDESGRDAVQARRHAHSERRSVTIATRLGLSLVFVVSRVCVACAGSGCPFCGGTLSCHARGSGRTPAFGSPTQLYNVNCVPDQHLGHLSQRRDELTPHLPNWASFTHTCTFEDRHLSCSSGWPRPHAHPCDGPGGSGDCRGIGLVDRRGQRTVGQPICNTFYQDSRCSVAGCSTVYKDGRFWSGRRAIE